MKVNVQTKLTYIPSSFQLLLQEMTFEFMKSDYHYLLLTYCKSCRHVTNKEKCIMDSLLHVIA